MLLHLLRVAHSVLREHLSKIASRSGEWPTVRKKFLKGCPSCSACGGILLLQVHHKMPFHDDPAKELDPTNLITLCMGTKNECHLQVGHCGNYKLFNPNVAVDAATILQDPQKFSEVVARAKVSALPNVPGGGAHG